jgi:prophage antirepressor-like protein
MIEEIKDDTNCIVKAFENNPISILHEENNGKKIYFFKSSDIGKALDLKNIAVSIQCYDEDERVIRKAYDTTKRLQDTTFLTSQGVYRLLYNSKKEVAKKFRKWAGNILDDIIFNESIELKKQLEEKEKQHQIELQEKNNNIESQQLLIKKKDKELKQMAKKISLDWLYIAVTDNIDGVSKIGIAEEILKRIDGHLTSNPGFKYIFTYQSKNNKLIEKCIKALLEPFLTNKSEWFNIDSRDLIFIVKFFIELFDKNNGSEDPKLIVDFIKNISKKEIEQEYISNDLYNKFFDEEIDIDKNGDKNYKCTLISIQKEFEKWLDNKNININKCIKKSDKSIKYLDLYTLDVKRYIKTVYNKMAERIHIDDTRNDIHISSVIGYTGFRMKNLYADKYFDEEIYINFIENHLIIDNKSRISLSEILIVFNEYLESKNIDTKKVKKKKYFTISFREEFAREIEKYSKLQLIKKLNTGKRNGYAGFIGIKISI